MDSGHKDGRRKGGTLLTEYYNFRNYYMLSRLVRVRLKNFKKSVEVQTRQRPQ